MVVSANDEDDFTPAPVFPTLAPISVPTPAPSTPAPMPALG